MFHGETLVDIDENIDRVYGICKKNYVQYVTDMRAKVEVLDQKENYIKLKIYDYVSSKKASGKLFFWFLDTFFDDNNKQIKHVQTEGPISGLVAIWYFTELGDNKTRIICKHDYKIKNIPILNDLIAKFVYKTQIKPYVDKLFLHVKEEAEKK
ncbi:hypothetical protein HZA55_07155 [Candidatus Poribacteria bacterium]|nr:hypothetical protein [Candidatus Poribacteria bacterium]